MSVTLEDAKKREIVLNKGGASPAGWSSIESFLRCPKEFQLAHVRGIKKPDRVTKDALGIGSLFHAGRSVLFARRFSLSSEVFREIEQLCEQTAESFELPVNDAAVQKAKQIVTEYAEFWGKRPTPTPLFVEHLVGPAEFADGFHETRTARLDDVSFYPEAGNRLCIGEAKTTSTTVADVENTYTLHGQPLLQHLLWRRDAANGAATNGQVAGTLLDVVVKKYDSKEKTGFGRVFVPVTEYVLNWYAPSLARYVLASRGVTWDSEVPRNPTACTRQYGRMRAPCEFRDLCQHGKSATGMYSLKDGSSLKDQTKWKGMKAPWE